MSKKELPEIKSKKVNFRVFEMPEDVQKVEELLNDGWQGIPSLSSRSYMTLAKEQ